MSFICLVGLVWLARYCSKMCSRHFFLRWIASNETFLFRLVPGYVPRVYGYNRGSNSLGIYWSPIPEEDTHGVLLGYVVYFRRDGSYENFTTVKVNSSTLVLRITGLLEATTYEIKVAGRTSVGEGPLSTTYGSTGG